MPNIVKAVPDTWTHAGRAPSAQGWFAGGERTGYDPLRERFARFGLQLHADKTRIVEFGP